MKSQTSGEVKTGFPAQSGGVSTPSPAFLLLAGGGNSTSFLKTGLKSPPANSQPSDFGMRTRPAEGSYIILVVITAGPLLSFYQIGWMKGSTKAISLNGALPGQRRATEITEALSDFNNSGPASQERRAFFKSGPDGRAQKSKKWKAK